MQGCTNEPIGIEIVRLGKPVRPGDLETLTVLSVDEKDRTKPVIANWEVDGDCVALLNSAGHAAYVLALTPGIYSVTAIKGDLVDTKEFAIYMPVTSKIICINDYPDIKIRMLVGESKEIPAYGFDQYGREIHMDLEWSVTDGLGEFTKLEEQGWTSRTSFKATKGGIGWITASEGEASASFLIAIWPYEQVPTSIDIDPDDAQMSVGQWFSFSASVDDQLGNRIVDSELTWQLSGDIGSINPNYRNCLFIAEKAGSGTLTVRSSGLSATATIRVVN